MSALNNFIFVVLLALTFADWPCPLSSDIFPCTCTANEQFETDIECSAVHDDETLATVFQQVFPFYTCRKFTMIHDNQTIDDALSMLNSTTFGMISFQEIYIQGTTLTTIKPGTFSNSNDRITVLTLRDNRVSTFPFDDISNFSVLEILYLHGNALTEVSQIISTTVQHVTISQNWALTVDGDEFQTCPQIITLDISENGLTSVPLGLVNSLTAIQELQLSGNEIEIISAGEISPPSASIRLLSLKGNGLKTLEAGAITGIDGSGFLDFSNNSIVDLTETTWHPLFNMVDGSRSLNLSDNPLRCGCDMAWIIISVADLDKLTDGTTCADGTYVKDLPTAPFLTC